MLSFPVLRDPMRCQVCARFVVFERHGSVARRCAGGSRFAAHRLWRGGGGGGGGNANVLPAASFTATPASGTPPLAVAFNASASSDTDGTITGYAWNFGDSTSATGVTANHTYTAVGTYTATLTVTDNSGATAQATRTIQVTTPNLPPTASFQFVPTGGAAPLLVFFDGSQSTDPEGPVADYLWDFGDGTGTVTGKTPTHTFAASGAFTVRLTVSDPQGLTGTTTQVVTVAAGSGVGNVTVSGRVTYERVPFSSTISSGLNYANTSAQPAREIVVELLTPAQAVLATGTTDSNGSYAFTAPANTNVFVRAKAQSLRGSSPTRNIRVLNNTNGNALYVLDGAAFNTGTTNQTRNLLAASGWGGSSYTGTRAAAPFAILDTLYSAVEFILDNGNAALNLPALDVFWSTQNNPSSGDVALGNIESTLYRTGSVGGPPAGIYVLGLQNNDTDEYDQHVLAHEFNHFLEDCDQPHGHDGRQPLVQRSSRPASRLQRGLRQCVLGDGAERPAVQRFARLAAGAALLAESREQCGVSCWLVQRDVDPVDGLGLL